MPKNSTMRSADPSKRDFCRTALGTGAALLALSPYAPAQAGIQAPAFPSKPITLLVPFPAGGATDVQMRALARAASQSLRQPIVIVNQPGVSGTLAAAAMARSAAPDGYTIAMISAALFRLPHVQKVNYDPVADFSYIIGVTNYSFGVVVAADAPWKTLPELIAAVKAAPDKISFGGIGQGSSGHIGIARLARAAGFALNYVPFKGGAEVLQATMGGHVQVMTEAGWGSMVESGKLRLLAVMDEQRTPRWPQVPTLKDLGYDIAVRSPVGLAGPKGMNPLVVKTLHDAFFAASSDAQFLKALEVQGQPYAHLDTAQYSRFAVTQTASDKRFVDELGFKLNE